MLHVFTDEEQRLLLGEEGAWFETGSFGGPAKPGIPNVGWAMTYGAEYASEVDIEMISFAGFPIERNGDCITVRVTDNIDDVVNNFKLFSQRRAELKHLFRKGLFWIDD